MELRNSVNYQLTENNMSQIINALPDVNREDNTPDIQIAVHNIGADVSMSEKNRNPAISDENQERVLPTVGISTGNPDMPNGRYDMIQKRGVTGNIPQPVTDFAVGPQYRNVKTSMEVNDTTDDGPKSNSL